MDTKLFVRQNPGGLMVVVDGSWNPGSIYFVGSAVAGATDAEGYGRNPDAPFATLAYALTQVSAGDDIYVLPGHTEDVATAGGVSFTKAGVRVFGLGTGNRRPTFTFKTSTAADFNVAAEGVVIKNLKFVSGIDSLVNFLDLDEGNFLCEDCEFVTASTLEALCFVDIATTKDNFTFRRCKFFQPTDPAGADGNAGTGCFYFVDSENLFFEDCFFYGNFESAIFHNKTTAAKNVWILNCFGTQLLAGAEVTIQVAAMEGGAKNSFFVVSGSADVAEANTWGTMSDKFFIDLNSCVGNDGAGGQLAVAGATAAS